MGIFSSSWERQVDNSLFDFIDVAAFKNYRSATLFNYGWMIFMLLLQSALYAVDVYTCVKLLAFNEWSSMVKPYLSFRISKWLFAACIICSVVLLAFDFIRGIRIYRTRNISLIYTNGFAKMAKSLAGYAYFCVLDVINPTSGFDKMAFYTWFTLDSSKKLILADSPRQVINALTLYSVLNVGNGGFWDTIKTISATNRAEALILYSMSISFIIWIFFISCLFFAICFCFPVYYRIRKDDYQGLRQYVCLKVDQTVKKLARKYAKERLRKEQRKYQQEDFSEEKRNVPDVELPPLTPYGETKFSLPKSYTTDSFSSEASDSTQWMNPFTDKFSQPKATYHKNSSQTSILNRYDHHSTQKSVYGPPLRQYGSQISFNDSRSSIREPLYHSESQISLNKIGTKITINELTPQEPMDVITDYPRRKVFLDEEKLIGDSHDPFADDDQEDENDSGDRLTRKAVRPSLILRARDMESEDYSRFAPTSNEIARGF
jgi:hypothetical protein